MNKILHVIWSGHVGGAETLLLPVLLEMQKYDDFEHHICIMSNEGVLVDVFRSHVKHVHVFHVNNGLKPVRISKLHRLRPYIQLLRKEKFHIVHVHTSILMILATKICSNSLVVFTNHGGSLLNQKSSLWKQRVSKLFIDHYIAISQYVLQAMTEKLKISQKHIDLIYNGLVPQEIIRSKTELKHELGISQSYNVVGTIGRLISLKGIQYLISALPHLLDRLGAVKLLIIGDGPYMGELVQLANQLQVQDHILFLGFRTDARQWLQAMDVFCFPSTGDGFGMVVLEAMDAGIPVVAYDHGAMREIIENGVNGYIVSPSFEDLIEHIVAILSDPSISRKFTYNAKETIRSKFAMETMVQSTMSLYKRLIQRKNKGSSDE